MKRMLIWTACATFALSGALLVAAPVPAHASDDVARVGETAYSEFADAIAAWEEGTTLTLLQDVKGVSALSLEGDRTLDFKGHVLQGDGKDTVLTLQNGTLTLKDTGEGGGLTGGKGVFGGGVRLIGGALVMEGGSIYGNEATRGGGVYLEDSDMTLSGGTIMENEATLGGGVYAIGGTLTLSAGAVSGNASLYNGGGVYVSAAGIALSGAAIEDNSAGFGGGGVFLDGCVFNITGGSLARNEAELGGGVYLHGGSVSLSAGTVSKNNASSAGGGFFLHVGESDATLAISGGALEGNLSAGSGGAVYAWTETAFVMTGGSVTGSSSGTEGAVCVFGVAALGGNASITENFRGTARGNLFLMQEGALTVQSGYNGACGIGMAEAGVLAEDYTGDGSGFVSDDDGFTVAAEGGRLLLMQKDAPVLSVAKQPEKTHYREGENFDATGMEVEVVYPDGTRERVTDFTVEGGENLRQGTTEVKLRYTTPDGKEAETSVFVTVEAKEQEQPGTDDPPPKDPEDGKDSDTDGNGGENDLRGLIALIVLSVLYVGAFIAVAIVTHGFRGQKKN